MEALEDDVQLPSACTTAAPTVAYVSRPSADLVSKGGVHERTNGQRLAEADGEGVELAVLGERRGLIDKHPIMTPQHRASFSERSPAT